LSNQTNITVFEHQILKIDKGEVRLTLPQLKSLQSYYGDGVPYFSLTHNGVQFNEYVGVIQVGNLLIEVLPKADKYSTDKDTWRKMLIGMLKTVYGFDIKATSNASLKIKPNTILDLYFELFIKEVEVLLHGGLIKRYRKKEGSINVLKGTLLFNKQIQFNISNQEKFFTRYTTYDTIHPLHKIIYKTLCLLKQINVNQSLNSRLGSLLLNFPEMPNINVTDATFNKLVLNRKSLVYKKAIEISKMILLHYHPDVSKGKNDVLAIMFDMNKLWEQFVFHSIKKHKSNSFSVLRHQRKNFWTQSSGTTNTIIPDIVIKNAKNEYLVLDTKWKNLNGKNPSPDDLRQLFVYHHYYSANKVALVYPGNYSNINGYYFEPNNTRSEKTCSIISLEENTNIKRWQLEIANKIEAWANEYIPYKQA
jgi:5-methylcytosine-specific restriction enzyme subunit McrC